MRTFRRLAVYCGSSVGRDPAYAAAASSLGHLLATRGIGLVYGGGSVGLMGIAADAALRAGGEVIGVIPEKLQALELGKADCTTLHVVPDMHARKKLMADLSDGFIALPGGYGTMEELFEAVTWTQLAYHDKPVGALNVAGYYDPLIAMLSRMRDEGFVRPMHSPLLQVHDDAASLIDALATVSLPPLSSWIDDV
jgi:uncharacterized protein (TIGR00730 family)